MNEEDPSRLYVRLRDRIRRCGPITFKDWMEAALYDPSDGYYHRTDRLRQGRYGDYRTAPETSALFGVTFGRFFQKLFAELGTDELTLCEIGAGQGDFAAAILNSLQQTAPSLFERITYIIDEVSIPAQRRLAERLASFGSRIRFQRLIEVQPFVGIIFANELIDAFAVHRVVWRDGKLRELCVGLENDSFIWVECEPVPVVEEYLRSYQITLHEDQIIEVNLQAEEFIAQASAVLTCGFVVTVDYGAEREELFEAPHRSEGTLRAFYRHQLINDVLLRPGEQDLTTTVDWTQLREAGERVGLQPIRHERLDEFLLVEGVLDELQKITGLMQDAEAVRLRTSARELIMPAGLAAHFQILVQSKRTSG